MGETKHIDFHDFFFGGAIGTFVYGFDYTTLLLKARETNSFQRYLLFLDITNSESFFEE